MRNTNPQNATLRTATFVGECGFCMQTAFEDIDGVTSVLLECNGQKNGANHMLASVMQQQFPEVIYVTYDTRMIAYKQLLQIYWEQVDPVGHSTLCGDTLSSYGTAIICHNNDQKQSAEESIQEIQNRTHKAVTTKILEYKSLLGSDGPATAN